MLKKLLIGLFLLGMLCGAGFISAGPYSGGWISEPSGGVPVTSNMDIPKGKAVICGGNC